ncbi:MmcQ/YjbR family DNA-binding protein [Pseudomonas abieticivorans]|uniref:MmcQ/YjbR family DNA-binding protein n=1 Tax=Pseudomonas abieticivorans TaxID=2931382 RepID=UPI0020C17817|nr:MmcQ/YjbR family DNA-binding protein [Pseudomonas sp. PIA16]
MTEHDVVQFCLSLPGAREDYKWGGVRVFSIADTKMFALIGLAGDGVSFKVDQALFLGHVDRPGVRPAPYLARAHWVSVAAPYALGDAELRGLLKRSHQLVVQRLAKKRQVGLLLD